MKNLGYEAFLGINFGIRWLAWVCKSILADTKAQIDIHRYNDIVGYPYLMW